jgi:hypothetical protein
VPPPPPPPAPAPRARPTLPARPALAEFTQVPAAARAIAPPMRPRWPSAPPHSFRLLLPKRPPARRPPPSRQADFTPVFLTNAVGPFLVVQQVPGVGAGGGGQTAATSGSRALPPCHPAP